MASSVQNVSKFEVDGHVARITLNRPERLNAFKWQVCDMILYHNMTHIKFHKFLDVVNPC